MMNSKVIVIPAKKKKGNSIKESEKKKLRVAAYARVSTDSDEQATSYDTQVDHYTNYIKKNPDWEFAGVFLMKESVEHIPRKELALIK